LTAQVGQAHGLTRVGDEREVGCRLAHRDHGRSLDAGAATACTSGHG
jgi:hypothetical protein